MRVVMAESSEAMGGQEQAVLLHAQGLCKRGHELRLILEPESPIYRLAKQRGLAVDAVSTRPFRYPSAMVAFRQVMRRQKAEILHVNSSRDSWVGSLAARLLRPRPLVIRTRHISTPLNKNMATRFLYGRLIDRVIVTGGDRTRRALIERDGLDAERVEAFPIGLDLEYFRPAPPERDLRLELGLAGHRLVGLIAYLRDYKGHEYFIEAAARLLRRHTDVSFLIVGEGPEEQAIRSRIESLRLSSRILMLGFRHDLLNVFRSLDVFVVPSVEGDTIPQVLMQALALSLPVVSTSVGSIPDVICDGETGFIVPPRNAEALADRIEVLLAAPDLRAQMGYRGRTLVERFYSLDRMLDKLESVYRKVLHP
jgi:glycosyltransferase involved in cell wall biosynthesis